MSGHLHLSAGIHRGGQKLLQKQSFQFPSLRPGHWNKMKRKWGNRERGKGQTRRKRGKQGGKANKDEKRRKQGGEIKKQGGKKKQGEKEEEAKGEKEIKGGKGRCSLKRVSTSPFPAWN